MSNLIEQYKILADREKMITDARLRLSITYVAKLSALAFALISFNDSKHFDLLPPVLFLLNISMLVGGIITCYYWCKDVTNHQNKQKRNYCGLKYIEDLITKDINIDGKNKLVRFFMIDGLLTKGLITKETNKTDKLSGFYEINEYVSKQPQLKFSDDNEKVAALSFIAFFVILTLLFAFYNRLYFLLFLLFLLFILWFSSQKDVKSFL